MTPLLCFALYFDVNPRERICVDLGYYLPYTCGTVGTASRKRDTVISLVSNPQSIRDCKNRGINGTGVSSTQAPGSQNCLVFPRESGWIKYLNICPVLYCSILSSWCLDEGWCPCARKANSAVSVEPEALLLPARHSCCAVGEQLPGRYQEPGGLRAVPSAPREVGGRGVNPGRSSSGAGLLWSGSWGTQSGAAAQRRRIFCVMEKASLFLNT